MVKIKLYTHTYNLRRVHIIITFSSIIYFSIFVPNREFIFLNKTIYNNNIIVIKFCTRFEICFKYIILIYTKNVEIGQTNNN